MTLEACQALMLKTRKDLGEGTYVYHCAISNLTCATDGADSDAKILGQVCGAYCKHKNAAQARPAEQASPGE